MWIYNTIKRRMNAMSNLPEPQTRHEQFLAHAAGMDIPTPPTPITREEQYLDAICKEIDEGGGGGGGTTNYNNLSNKPQINNVTLQGNATLEALGVASNSTMTGATSAANGAKGLVPAPTKADKDKYLKGDGTWGTPSGGGGTSDYGDLTNKPQINGHTLTGNQSSSDLGIKENVQADWNANSGDSQILNKPTIPAAQIQSDWEQLDNTKADFIKNKPTIPTAQVNADWNSHSGVSEILNKPTLGTASSKDTMAAVDMSEIVNPLPGIMSRRMKYSENEQVIGEWIDGKPLYQKTVVIENFSVATNSNTDKKVAENVGALVNCYGTYSDGNFTQVFPFSALNITNGGVSLVISPMQDGTDCFVRFKRYGAAFTVTKLVATVHYTKTTD